MAHAVSPLEQAALRPERRLARSTIIRGGHALASLAYWLTLLNAGDVTARGVVVAGALAAGWSLCLEARVLGDRRPLRSPAFLGVRLASASSLYLVTVLAASTVVRIPADDLHLAAGVLELAVLAFVFQAYLARGLGLGRPLRCVLVGSQSSARLLRREPLAPGAAVFELVGLLRDAPAELAGEHGPVPVLGDADDLERVVARHMPDLVLIGARSGRPALFSRVLGLGGDAPGVVELPEFFEHAFGRVPVDEITSTWFLDALRPEPSRLRALAKRGLDLVVASALLIVAAPLMLAAALAVRLTSPGPILYRQDRVGEHGRVYTVAKFRSMRVDAERDGAVWALEDDPRVTSVGRHLRRFRVDELPQLLNVLRGDMTMVGPRPERPEFVRDLVEAVPFYEPRHLTKPGLTGWAQVSAGYAATLDDARLKLSYDLWYLKHRSLSLDLAILLRTVAVVVKGTGAR